jgi:tetratricopeptide (TPR) repeat protein
MRMKDRFQFLKSYCKLWKAHGSLPPFHWVRATQLLSDRDYARAAVSLMAGIHAKPRHRMAPYALVDLARCCYKQGDTNQAEFYLLEAVRLKPTLREAHLRLCVLACQLGDWVLLCERAKDALSSMPSDAEFTCLLNIGAVAQDPLGDAADAASVALSQARAFTPRDELFIRVARAAILIGRGESGRAVGRLKTITKTTGSPLVATICLCRALLDSGHPLEARLAAREALRRFPGDLQLLSMAIESYLEEGTHCNPEHALELAEVVVQRTDWQNPHAIALLARAYSATGDRMAALVVAQRAYAVSSQRVGCHIAVDIEEFISELEMEMVA